MFAAPFDCRRKSYYNALQEDEMASTVTRKRPLKTKRTTSRDREPRVGDMTLGEFRTMMNVLIDARFAKWVDPDAGLELRPEVVERIQRQRAEFAAGERGKSLDEIASKYGLEL